MKHLLFTLLLLPVVVCRSGAHRIMTEYSSGIAGETMDTTNTLEGRWTLLPVMQSDTAAGKIPYIIFDLKQNRFSGNSGCNNMNGSFMVKQDALQFGENMVSTKMDCPGYNEKSFLDNLLKTNRYEIKDGTLQLMYNTTILSRWVRHLDKTPTRQI